ncbi:MAG: efflux RND transporter permease subunit [Hyphomicrobiales bacterium]
MFAFLMAIGIVVDDAIVVSDNVDRHRRMGKGRERAAIDGTVEVIPSVISSVLTTVITFLPLCFVSGVMGKFIAVMPFAFITALLMSLAESTLVLPGHLAHEKNLIFTVLGFFLTPLKPLMPLVSWAQRTCDRTLKWFVKTVYAPTLDMALDNRLSVLAIAAGLLLLAVGLVRSGATPFSLFPKVDANRLMAKVSFPDGTPASVTEEATSRIEQAAFDVAQRLAPDGAPIVELVNRSVGSVSMAGEVGPGARASGSHVGSVSVELVDGEKRSVTSEEFISEWRKAAGDFPGIDSLVYDSENIGPGGKPIDFKLLAPSDPEVAQPAGTGGPLRLQGAVQTGAAAPASLRAGAAAGIKPQPRPPAKPLLVKPSAKATPTTAAAKPAQGKPSQAAAKPQPVKPAAKPKAKTKPNDDA